MIVAVNVVGQRMDFYALLHSCALLAVLSRRRRKAIGEVWPKYCCFTAGLVVVQYLLCVGIPPALCVGTSGEERAGWLVGWLVVNPEQKTVGPGRRKADHNRPGQTLGLRQGGPSPCLCFIPVCSPMSGHISSVRAIDNG